METISRPVVRFRRDAGADLYKGMSIELDRHEIAPGVCRLWRDCLTLLEWIR